MSDPTQGDECECRFCRGTEPDAGGCARGMQPNFDRPEPAEFVASDEFEILEQYALGWTHGWDDHETSVASSQLHVERPLIARRGLINGFAIATIIWTVVGLFVLGCPAQVPAPGSITAGVGAFNYGYVTDSARTYLEQGWDTSNPAQAERGYCIEPTDVSVDTTPDNANVQWRIHHVTLPTHVTIATPYAISFHCSPTAVASMHVHTPTTCQHNDPTDALGAHAHDCKFGGNDAFLCSVDETDRMAAMHDWFMVVQCGRGQFIWYWPGRRG